MLTAVSDPPRGKGKRVQAGLLSGTELVELPVSALRAASNVGQPGKWVFRIDRQRGPSSCPAGSQGRPFCEDGPHFTLHSGAFGGRWKGCCSMRGGYVGRGLL